MFSEIRLRKFSLFGNKKHKLKTTSNDLPDVLSDDVLTENN